MFDYKDIAAFVLRFAIFMLIFSTYPLLSFFLNDMMLKLFFRNVEVTNTISFLINFFISFLPLLFALFYPNVGTILSYAGALSGFFIIYIFPVITHLKFQRTKIMNPLLAEAIQMNEYNAAPKPNDFDADAPLSPRIEISERYLNEQRQNRRVLSAKDK